jgi:hypothetical protein
MLDRNSLSIQRKTHDATALSEEQMGEIQLDFDVHVKLLIDLHGLLTCPIINMDETGCHFDMAPSTTIQLQGEKHVAMKGTGRGTGSTQCRTVFLAVSLDGRKLTPLIVFNEYLGLEQFSDQSLYANSFQSFFPVYLILFIGKPGKTIEKNLHKETDPRTVSCVQENAYCDEKIMLQWIEKCLQPFLREDPQV